MRYVIVVILPLIFSCSNTSSNRKSSENNSLRLGYKETVKDTLTSRGVLADTIYLDINGDEYAHLGQIPDSLRTSEQDGLLRRIYEVMVEYMVVEDGRVAFELTEEEFTAKGIPPRYYILIQENIHDNNVLFDSQDIHNVDQMIGEWKDEVRHYFKLGVPK